jgi:two-component system KDP operon response regulator KdpE
MAQRILIVDDEPQIRQVLRVLLHAHGYQSEEAATGADGLVAAVTLSPDLILLDIGLPDLSGIDVLRSIRQHSTVPVIVLTIHDEEHEKVTALDLGADDYVTKPFRARELMARIRVALRHHGQASQAPLTVLDIGPLTLDLERRLVKRRGSIVRLTPTEYELLRVLALNWGRVVTHRTLLKQVWGEQADDAQDAHYLRIYIGHLRKKIEDDPSQPQLILTEPGVGYRLVEPES